MLAGGPRVLKFSIRSSYFAMVLRDVFEKRLVLASISTLRT